MSEELERVARCPVHEINAMHPEVLRCPVTMNRRLREEAPVFRDAATGIYFVSRYADVLEMARDHEAFSSVMAGSAARAVLSDDPEIAEVMKDGYPNVPTMLTQDPPLQRRYRKFVDGAFSPSSIRKLAPFIEQTAHDLIDRFIDAGECELLEDFGIPLPLTVIGAQLGTPTDDLPKLRRWTEAFVANLGQQLDQAGAVEAAREIVAFQHYFVARMNERRESPRDDILSQVVNARVDGERPLDDAEALSMLQQILVAGNETTAATLTEGVWLLIRNPDQYEIVRDDTSPETLNGLVEEVLRVSSPSANMFRRTTRDVELAGETIPKDSVCFARFASADQDEAQFVDAMRFDVRRENVRDHLAFGKGVHHCLGANLARAELRAGFKALLDRLENFRLQPEGPEPDFVPNALLHGLNGLALAFDAR